MGSIQKSVATLRIVGDDLIPEEISRRLGCTPTVSQKKGDVIVGKRSGAKRTARTGMWSLHATDHEPEDLEAQIGELLSKVTSELAVWRDVVHKYREDLFCGLFTGSGNDGLSLSPDSLLVLGQRGIELALDIRGGVTDDSFRKGDPFSLGPRALTRMAFNRVSWEFWVPQDASLSPNCRSGPI